MVSSFYNYNLFYYNLEQVWSIFAKVFQKFIPALGFRFQICLAGLLNGMQSNNFYLITWTKHWLTMEAFIWKSSFAFWIWRNWTYTSWRTWVRSFIFWKFSLKTFLTKWTLTCMHMHKLYIFLISQNKCQCWPRAKHSTFQNLE